MLKIVDNLAPFFEDCYRRINVREYGRIKKISPPTASKTLFEYSSLGILSKSKERRYMFFYANKDSKEFIDLSRIYWNYKLKSLVSFLEENLANPTVILFGSLSKAEAKLNSDIDITVFSIKRPLDFNRFEKELKRNIQIFWFKSIQDVQSKELANNILNGYILSGKVGI